MYEYNAVIINAVDGDTVDALIDVGFKMTTAQRLRILGINTPELIDKDPVIKAKAFEAKVFITNLLLNKHVVIKTTKTDSFGRYLAEINIAGIDVGTEMVKLGYAVEYRK
jgi:micrococcal nuclease